MMVTVLLFGYATGTLPSRRIALKLEEGIAFRYVAAEGASLEQYFLDVTEEEQRL